MRRCRVRLSISSSEDLVIENLDMAFNVNLSLKKEPNKAQVQIWNLNESHRHDITKLSGEIRSDKIEGAILEIEAGYKDNVSRIFRGDMMNAEHVRDGADVITAVSAKDGGESYRSGHISKSFDKNTSVDAVIKACAEAMKIGTGNAIEATRGAKIKNLGAQFANGTALYGRASLELDRVLSAAGFEWSIQAGVLNVREFGKSDSERVLKISTATGMIGSPSYGVEQTVEQKKTKLKRFLSVRTLIIPGLRPGQRVELDSADQAGGTFRLEEVAFSGSTYGQEWYADMKLQAIQ